MSLMRISQLAERSGVPATTLRFYEGAGLLPAGRTASGYRVYGEDAVERLELIGAAKHLGLPLEEIGELLAVWESGACAEVKADLRPRVAARLAEAERRAAEQAEFTAVLRTALAHLDALPDRDGRCDEHCGLPAGPASGTTDGPAGTASRPVGFTARPAGFTARPGDVALSPAGQGIGQEAGDRRSAPVACSLNGAGMAERVAEWRELADGAVRVPIPDGLRLTLPAADAARVAGLAADEQRCCPFFDFSLHFDGASVHLEVRVPPEGSAMLTELFGPVPAA